MHRKVNKSITMHRKVNKSITMHRKVNKSVTMYRKVNKSITMHRKVNKSITMYRKVNKSITMHRKVNKSITMYRKVNKSITMHRKVNKSITMHRKVNKSVTTSVDAQCTTSQSRLPFLTHIFTVTHSFTQGIFLAAWPIRFLINPYSQSQTTQLQQSISIFWINLQLEPRYTNSHVQCTSLPDVTAANTSKRSSYVSP